MERTFLHALGECADGDKVHISGWVNDIRDLSKVKFVLLRDKTGSVQAVAAQGKTPEKVFDGIPKVTPESAVNIVGVLKKNKTAKLGYEVLIEDLEVLNPAQSPLPIDTSDKSKTHIDKRLDYRFLDTRRLDVRAIFHVRSRMVKAITDFFTQEGFVNITTPKITVAGVESGAELFKVDYFGKDAFLSQSPQIYKQMMVAAGFERVYEIGPVFRAEKSHTTRHLTEFTGIDFEMGFIKDEHEVMDTVEKCLLHIMHDIKEHCLCDLEVLGVSLTIPKKIPRLTMQEAQKLLAEAGKKVADDDDLDPEAEKLLGELVQKKMNSPLVFVTNYPYTKRPFYHMKPDNDPKGTRSFDALWTGLEIGTGAQREHRYEVLKTQAKEKGIDLDGMDDYANLFRFAIPPHGGIGMGLDRMTQALLGLSNVREAILLPRDTERLRP